MSVALELMRDSKNVGRRRDAAIQNEFDVLHHNSEMLLKDKFKKDKAAIRAKELMQIEKRVLNLHGKNEHDVAKPSEGLIVQESFRELELIHNIILKYFRVISYFKDVDNKEQLDLATTELQYALYIQTEMMFFVNFNVYLESHKDLSLIHI
eukprot:TRINITY_DN3617_c0_g3_i9.p1 TRINITY_DN3617_c0_g3~~TRINITY_DN3617_c0_g3_i9.p1  ORF type:complete len:152 (-),score=28.58 TRINITY_DN3617_c0_g3_i9:62-517(-)